MTDAGPDVNLFTEGQLGDDAIVRGSAGYLPVSTFTANVMDSLVSVEITDSLNDKMMRGIFTFSGNVEPAYYEKFSYAIPDYSGTSQVVFVGIFVDGETSYSAEKDQTTCIAYDFSWYLTMNYPQLTDRNLLSIIDQDKITYYRLDFTNYTGLFGIGDIITGATSGHIASVWEVDQFDHYLIITIISGSPDGDGDYFTDTEYLKVNGTNIATADGQTVVYTVSDYYPEDWVERLLENVDGGGSTGIDAYRMANSATLWDTIQKTFFFEDLETIIQVIDKVADYMDYIFYRRWVTVAGSPKPSAYFIPEDDIDSATDGLDLPAKVTITPTSYAVISPARYERKGGQNFNRIIVKCKALAKSEWYRSVKETSEITNGKTPRTYKEINEDISSQDDADDRADDLYDYYCTPILKYDVTLRARSDLRKLQLLAFSGFTQITSGDYRIVDIRYVYDRAGTVNRTQVTVIPDSQFRAYLQLKRTFTEHISRMRAVIRDIKNGEPEVEIGTVTDVTDDEVTATLEQGLTSLSRDAS